MNSREINKYNKKRLQDLIRIAERHVNMFIRIRDEGKPCVSCGKFKVLQAGHFYSAGHYSSLRFNADNIHGQCIRCNMHLSGNLNEYRKRIESRIGKEGLERLDMLADHYKRGFKYDRG